MSLVKDDQTESPPADANDRRWRGAYACLQPSVTDLRRQAEILETLLEALHTNELVEYAARQLIERARICDTVWHDLLAVTGGDEAEAEKTEAAA